MITEDYISFECAKLLENKGFYSEDCFAFYKENGEIGFLQTFGDIADYDSETCVVAPTLQMAMKWLREKYNIHIEIHYLHKSEDYSYVINNVSNGGIMCVNGFDSYENAVEAAILECLTNLI